MWAASGGVIPCRLAYLVSAMNNRRSRSGSLDLKRLAVLKVEGFPILRH